MVMESTGRFTSELRRLRRESYDECRSCGQRLTRDRPAYAGYAIDGSPLYVGDCCLEQLSELASHIYWWWEVDRRVSPDEKLWRYMDLSKLIAMLEDQSLFFARADKLGDPFEGASGLADREPEWDNFYLDYFREAIRTLPSELGSPDKADVEAQAQRLLREIKQGAEFDRRTTFVSCWHLNSGESEAFWRLYCPQGSAGVAIETTTRRLTESLGTTDVDLGEVHYIDFKKSFAGIHDRIFWKRNSLKHEAEVRAVYRLRFDKPANGVNLTVDLSTLIGGVVVSPFGPPWLSELLPKILERYQLSIEVRRSELLAQPFF